MDNNRTIRKNTVAFAPISIMIREFDSVENKYGKLSAMQLRTKLKIVGNYDELTHKLLHLFEKDYIQDEFIKNYDNKVFIEYDDETLEEFIHLGGRDVCDVISTEKANGDSIVREMFIFLNQKIRTVTNSRCQLETLKISGHEFAFYHTHEVIGAK
jgi:hypothetical protein